MCAERDSSRGWEKKSKPTSGTDGDFYSGHVIETSWGPQGGVGYVQPRGKQMVKGWGGVPPGKNEGQGGGGIEERLSERS